MSIALYVVDAFADEPFRGNPAAVCLMTASRPEPWFQSVAAELNLSETAFVWQRDDCFLLRWFTPKSEVDLCGHATLATAHILWQTGWLAPQETAAFDSRSGQLRANSNNGKIYLDFPTDPPSAAATPAGLIDSLGVEPIFVGRNQADILVEVATETEVTNTNVDFRRLADTQARGVILTSASDADEFDFISRFFAPAVGIDEDPVTGSAHCCLGPYWSKKLGKTKLVAFQASQRGGRLELEIDGDRIHIGGTATTISKGELLV